MAKTRELPKLLKVSQVAEMLNCANSSVYDMIARRDLGSIRVGPRGAHRIPFDDLEAMIEKGMTPARRHSA